MEKREIEMDLQASKTDLQYLKHSTQAMENQNTVKTIKSKHKH